MAVQLTIVGLGQIGASVGLALAERKGTLKRIGHDKEPRTAQQAQRLGAVDQVVYNLPAAVREADIVLLALPLSAVRETLEIISPELKENAVVLDTAPAKSTVTGWAKELLPGGRCYVGLVPAINPAYLRADGFGAQAAHADLFREGVLGIVSPPETPGEAIQVAVDLAGLLGADPLFVDLAEADGLMSTVHLVPQLLAAALLNATIDQPGWADGRKLAGRAFAGATGPLLYQDQLGGLRDGALYNRDNVVRGLDRLIAALQAVRDDVAAGAGESLTRRLEQAYDGRIKWQGEREAAQWRPAEYGMENLPKQSGFLGQVFFGSRSTDKEKK